MVLCKRGQLPVLIDIANLVLATILILHRLDQVVFDGLVNLASLMGLSSYLYCAHPRWFLVMLINIRRMQIRLRNYCIRELLCRFLRALFSDPRAFWHDWWDFDRILLRFGREHLCC